MMVVVIAAAAVVVAGSVVAAAAATVVVVGIILLNMDRFDTDDVGAGDGDGVDGFGGGDASDDTGVNEPIINGFVEEEVEES